MKYKIFVLLTNLVINSILCGIQQSVGDQDVKFMFETIRETYNWKSLTSSIRVYYIFEDTAYSFTDFNLNSDVNILEGETYLFSNWNIDTIKSNGIWGGVGFGSQTMLGSDFIIFHYEGNDNWRAYDAFTPLEQPNNIKVDDSFNNVRLIKKVWFPSIDSLKFRSYTNMFYFKWTKDLTKTDSNDFGDLVNWRTKEFPTISAFGYLHVVSKVYTPQRHLVRSKINLTVMKNGSNEPDISSNNGNGSGNNNGSSTSTTYTPTKDTIVSIEKNWLIPFYDICEFRDYGNQHGNQMYFEFKNDKTVMLLDLRISQKIVRGATYLLTKSTHTDISPYGVYCGIIFGDTLKNSYGLQFSYTIGNDIKSYQFKDIRIDSTGSLITDDTDTQKSKYITNNSNNALTLLKSAWFNFDNDTKVSRFTADYNSLLVFYWEINLNNHKGFKLKEYLSKNPEEANTSKIIGLYNRNNQERQPIFVDNQNTNGVLTITDGDGLKGSSLELDENFVIQCRENLLSFSLFFVILVILVVFI